MTETIKQARQGSKDQRPDRKSPIRTVGQAINQYSEDGRAAFIIALLPLLTWDDLVLQSGH